MSIERRVKSLEERLQPAEHEIATLADLVKYAHTGEPAEARLSPEIERLVARAVAG